MTSVRAWRLCAAAGVAAFLYSWGFGRIPGLAACGPSGGLGPILAFEFVRSPADLAALFGGEPCRSSLVRAQTIGLLLDGLAFIPAYTTFLIFATMASARVSERWPPAAMLIAFVLGLAGLFDEIEGVLLYRILSDLPGTPMLINTLWWPVHLKFALLGFGTLGIGCYLAVGRSLRNYLATPAIAGAVVALAALAGGEHTYIMIGFTIAWVTILLAALAASIRPSLFAAP